MRSLILMLLASQAIDARPFDRYDKFNLNCFADNSMFENINYLKPKKGVFYKAECLEASVATCVPSCDQCLEHEFCQNLSKELKWAKGEIKISKKEYCSEYRDKKPTKKVKK